MDLVDLNLTSSVGKFGNHWYRKKVGVVTGGSLSVSIANIAVFYALRCVKEDSISTHLLSFPWWHYGTMDWLQGWIYGRANSVNNHLGNWGLSIKDNKHEDWQFSHPSDYCDFFYILEGLITDVNIKSTDARVYPHFSSFHPRNTLKSIV